MKQFSYLLIISFLLVISTAKSQISHGGYPQSFANKQLQVDFQRIEIFTDKNLISIDQKKFDADVVPYKIGFTIATDYSPINSGTWFTLANGDKIWKIEIKSTGAEALAVYFKNFELSDDAELFMYNKSKSQVIGSFTAENNSESGYFATELIEGDVVIFEYFVSASHAEKNPFTISEIGYINKSVSFKALPGYNASGSCLININCVEGQNWQQQKKGVARIHIKQGSEISLCTGSLVNSTRNDFAPYFLTANHCGANLTEAEYDQLVFYFNYESPDCDNPMSEPIPNTMTGASLIASANGTSSSSDFKLLLLNDNVPEEYDPYFNGWSRSLIGSNSGVGIHHPQGDIKKISTYNSPLKSSDYSADADNVNGKYWRVVWAETANGHSITEGGSSGSPIFNSDGLIVGTLSGGDASCSDLTGPDYYGKFSYSWESNGSTEDKQLRPWLDPINNGAVSPSGVSYNDILFIPEFTVDTVHVPIGGSVIFTDLSVGNPSQWDWTFSGGNPASSTLQTPPPITYETLGNYNVSLNIKNGLIEESLLKENYIKVVPKIGPIPSSDMVTLYLGTTPVSDVILTLYDESGRELEKHIIDTPTKYKHLYLGRYSAAYYFLKVETSNSITLHKIAIY